jgi:hypothetical protein
VVFGTIRPPRKYTKYENAINLISDSATPLIRTFLITNLIIGLYSQILLKNIRELLVLRHFTEYRPASVIQYFTGDTFAFPYFRENNFANHILYEIYIFNPVLFGRQCAFLIPYFIRYIIVVLLILISTHLHS